MQQTLDDWHTHTHKQTLHFKLFIPQMMPGSLPRYLVVVLYNLLWTMFHTGLTDELMTLYLRYNSKTVILSLILLHVIGWLLWWWWQSQSQWRNINDSGSTEGEHLMTSLNISVYGEDTLQLFAIMAQSCLASSLMTALNISVYGEDALQLFIIMAQSCLASSLFCYEYKIHL